MGDLFLFSLLEALNLLSLCWLSSNCSEPRNSLKAKWLLAICDFPSKKVFGIEINGIMRMEFFEPIDTHLSL